MVSHEFVIQKLNEQARWKTLPIIMICTMEEHITVGILVSGPPFNLWIPLEDMDEEDFTPYGTAINPETEKKLIKRYYRPKAA